MSNARGVWDQAYAMCCGACRVPSCRQAGPAAPGLASRPNLLPKERRAGSSRATDPARVGRHPPVPLGGSAALSAAATGSPPSVQPVARELCDDRRTLSTSNTRSPRRASNMLVGEPAQRAPTTIASYIAGPSGQLDVASRRDQSAPLGSCSLRGDHPSREQADGYLAPALRTTEADARTRTRSPPRATAHPA